MARLVKKTITYEFEGADDEDLEKAKDFGADEGEDADEDGDDEEELADDDDDEDDDDEPEEATPKKKR